MATVKAELNNLRQAPRKVRAVVSAVKGKSALKALEQLEFLIRRPALPISKLLRSAIANAENNFNMVPSNLYIKEFYVNEGVKLKRYRPKARGAVGEIQKKISHIHLVLGEKVPGLKAEKRKEEHKSERGESKSSFAKATEDKPEIKTEIGKKVEASNTKRRWFQRKSV